MNKRRTRVRRGMTFAELLMGMLVTAIIGGAVLVIFAQGLRLADTNAAYSAALRGAEASFEFLPREIGYASAVEILSADHKITDAALRDEGWRYVERRGDRLYVIRWQDDKKQETPVPGSEYLSKAEFGSAQPESGDKKLLRVSLSARKSEGLAEEKELSLYRTLLIRATDGLVGDSGPLLRYMPGSESEPDLRLYGGGLADGLASFDHDREITWSWVDYNFTLAVEGDLAFSGSIAEDGVAFKWILVDPGLLDDPWKENVAFALPENPAELKKFFDDSGFDVLQATSGARYLDGQIEVLAVDSNVDPDDEEVYSVRLKVSEEPQDVLGRYLVLAAVYTPRGHTRPEYLPVFTQVGKVLGDPLAKNLNETFKARKEGMPEPFGDGEGVDSYRRNLIRVNDGWGEEKWDKGDDGRGNITLTGSTQGSGESQGAVKAAVVLTPEYFAHMDTSLYGVTNYSVYIDASIKGGMEGGYGVLLNGTTSPQKDAMEAFASTGYVFQFDPGANGFLIRYYRDNIEIHRPSSRYSWVTQYGVRNLYFYDAGKKFPAPRSVRVLGANGRTAIEDFNKTVGEDSESGVFYRLPFNKKTNYSEQMYYSYALDDVQDSRNTTSAFWDTYGAFSTWAATSFYSPKILQTWNEDLNAEQYPNSNGFRWDGVWDADVDNAQSRANWGRRTILKLTVLEITEDIPASALSPKEWQSLSEGGHQAGDLFVRAELIVLKNPDLPPYDSRNYVYSKPMWFGKFRGDSWRGDTTSVFKKTGNTMMHAVSAPEPKPQGDLQSWRRRGMRVRSWKETVDASHPDYAPDTANIWTPPIAIDLNRGDVVQNQGGNDFGAYTLSGYSDPARPVVTRDSSGTYTGGYLPWAYGRLSLLRQSGNATPLYGLYALRGWDFGFNGFGSDLGASATRPMFKRYLTVLQGMQLAYQGPIGGRLPYAKDRERTFGLRVWSAGGKEQSGVVLYDTWIGEGFSTAEIRDILGLDPKAWATEESVRRIYETGK